MKDFPRTHGKEELLLHEFKLYIDFSQFIHSEDTDISVKFVFQTQSWDLKVSIVNVNKL